jgi:hypothetical protein
MKAILLSSTMLALAATQASALVIRADDTSSISSPIYFTGFEAASTTGPVVILPGPLPYSTSYSDGGLTVTAVGGQPSGGSFEPIGSYVYWNGIGQMQWYVPFAGYTAITLSGGGNFQALEFLATGGWRVTTTNYTAYEVLEQGAVVASGTLRNDAICCADGTNPYQVVGWQTIGFFGGGFDEVRLQNFSSAAQRFDPTDFQALALDNIAAIPSVAPVPGPIVGAGWPAFILVALWYGSRRRKQAIPQS